MADNTNKINGQIKPEETTSNEKHNEAQPNSNSSEVDSTGLDNTNTDSEDNTAMQNEVNTNSKETDLTNLDNNPYTPNFNVGDTVVVNYKITEGEKSRVQPFTGIVIGIKSSGISKTFTVRRVSVGSIGVERIFPLSSPNVESVIVKSRGKVRRAKLYYLRDRVGRSATKIKRKE